MKPAAWWLAIPAGASALAMLALGGIALWTDLGESERDTLVALLTVPRIALITLFALLVAAIVVLSVVRSIAPLERTARDIAERTRLVARGNPEYRMPLEDAHALREIAEAINDLAEVRSQLLRDVATTVAQAKARVEQERERLAALIAELEQSVLVCNRDGQVLLYNAAAEALLGARATLHDAGELGLGRSVYGILDRAVIQHAVEALERAVERGDRQGTPFVTATSDGRLLRIQAAPVVRTEAVDALKGELVGYVLLLTDVTQKVESDATRVALFQGLVESTRAALANIRAAIENLTENPQLDAPQRARFATIIQDEAVRLSERLHRLGTEAAGELKARWPLEDMRGEDLLTLARSRIERRIGLPTKLDAVDERLWLRVDSFPVAQGLSYLAQRLQEEFQIRELRFRLLPAGGHAQLDVLWLGPPLSSETAFAWQSDPFHRGGEDSALTLAQVVERHGGEAWYQRDVPAQLNYFRFLFPLAGSREAVAQRHAGSRPEFYDFDLFRGAPATRSLDDTALLDLAYTVFDTETTGLDPVAGDEIIAIGAVRIVNGRILKGESFQVLVDPRRPLSQTSIAVHGITPQMLLGQPTLDQVLPRLARFAEDTVLVGHNAAFDMRFLQLKEGQTGIVFRQPVLDTLLLSAIVHPAQASHALEDIATRLGVEVVGRHTAVGDALTTAEVFVRLIPLLVAQGIKTLGEARAASQRTYYARVHY